MIQIKISVYHKIVPSNKQENRIMFAQTNFEQLYGKHFITEALEAVKPRESFEIWKKCYLAFLEPIQVETIMKLHTEGNLQVQVLPEKIDHCRSDCQ